MSATPLRVLMCPPAYYTIGAQENPHMDVDQQPNMHEAWLQWVTIRNLYEMLGLKVFEIEPDQALFSQVFTANGAWGKKSSDTGKTECVLSNFKNYTRVAEKDYFRQWMERLKVEAFELPQGITFEGQGDVITLSATYLFGAGIRSSVEAREYVARLLKLDRPITNLDLISPNFYHLDTCCMSLRGTDKEAIIYYTGAFSPESLARLDKLQVEKFKVMKDLAYAFACNSVFVNDVVLLNIPFSYSYEAFELSASGKPLEHGGDIRYSELIQHLRDYHQLIVFLWKLGYKIIPVYTSEFKKSGAGVRCLTLFLD